MTSRDTLPWRKLLAGGLASVALIAAACETPRPEPVAPIELTREKVAPVEKTILYDTAIPKFIEELKQSVVVVSSDGIVLGRYAGEIPVAHLPPDGIQSIKADERSCGSEKCFAVRITLKPGQTLNTKTVTLPNKVLRSGQLDSVMEIKIDAMKFKIDEIEVKNDKSTMLMKDATLIPESEVLPGKVRLAGSTTVEVPVSRADETARVLYSEIPDSQRPQIIMRGGKALQEQDIPNILVYSADGSELRRSLAQMTRKSLLDEINPQDIAAIEVYKGNSCPAVANIPCPLIKIWIKAGREATYRKR